MVNSYTKDFQFKDLLLEADSITILDKFVKVGSNLLGIEINPDQSSFESFSNLSVYVPEFEYIIVEDSECLTITSEQLFDRFL